MRRFSPPVLGALGLAVGLFLALAMGQATGALDGVDQALLNGLEPLRNTTSIRWVRRLTRLGDGWVLTAVVLGAASLLWRRHLPEGRYLLITGAGSAAVGPLLKLLFARTRPDEALRLVSAGGYSFPSGHSFGSAVVYGALAIALGSCCRRVRGRVVAASAALVVAVGCSRVLLRVHYPSDVLAGWSAGTAWCLTLGRLLLDSWGRMERTEAGQQKEYR